MPVSAAALQLGLNPRWKVFMHPEFLRALRTVLGLAALGALGAAPLLAGPTSSNPFGLGVALGGGVLGDVANASLTGKYWFDGTHALDMGLGGGVGGLDLNADYLWHNFGVFHHRHGLALYYGPGAYVNVGNAFGTGIQGKIGVDWLIQGRDHRPTPWEVFGELVPAINIIQGVGFGVGADVGGRYYFW